MCPKPLADKTLKALFAVKSKILRFEDTNPSVIFRNFESKILPILWFVSEIWFNHTEAETGKLHKQFCKYDLCRPFYSCYVFLRSKQVRYKADVYKKVAINISLELLHNQKTEFIIYAIGYRLYGSTTILNACSYK